MVFIFFFGGGDCSNKFQDKRKRECIIISCGICDMDVGVRALRDNPCNIVLPGVLHEQKLRILFCAFFFSKFFCIT